MPIVLTEARVDLAGEPVITLIPPTPRVMPARVKQAPVGQPFMGEQAPREEQLQGNDSKLFWIVAPLSLLIAGSATFLVVRRWLNRGVKDNDDLA